MIFHIAVCSPDSVLRSRVERQCLDYYARRDDACIVEQLDGPEALLARDDAGERYELYLIELPSTAAAASLRAAAALAVVMIHVSARRKNPVGVSCNQAARFAVPLFIMLSGYGHMHSWLQHSGQSAVQTARSGLL